MSEKSVEPTREEYEPPVVEVLETDESPSVSAAGESNPTGAV